MTLRPWQEEGWTPRQERSCETPHGPPPQFPAPGEGCPPRREVHTGTSGSSAACFTRLLDQYKLRLCEAYLEIEVGEVDEEE